MIGILFRPIVTEKMTKVQDKGLYAFEVDAKSNKIDIARAVEKRWNVKVLNVRTMNYKGKSKSQMTKRGRFAGKTSHFKKAIVTLVDGQSIDISTGV